MRRFVFNFFRVEDNFNLSDSVLSPKLDGEDWTVQLLDKSPNGKVTLQYYGKEVETHFKKSC